MKQAINKNPILPNQATFQFHTSLNTCIPSPFPPTSAHTLLKRLPQPTASLPYRPHSHVICFNSPRYPHIVQLDNILPAQRAPVQSALPINHITSHHQPKQKAKAKRLKLQIIFNKVTGSKNQNGNSVTKSSGRLMNM